VRSGNLTRGEYAERRIYQIFIMNISNQIEQKTYLALQPILDRNQRTVAYELLFRSGITMTAEFLDGMTASANVIAHAFTHFGLDQILSRQLGFININEEMLMSDLIDVLPRDKIVLELLETIPVTPEVIDRCLALKAKGYILALDDFIWDDRFTLIIPHVDIIKFDLQQMDKNELSQTVARFKGYKVRLLAEKVETKEQFDFCHDLGFELFQGYYFAHPVIVSGRRIDAARMALLKLLQQIQSDDSFQQIEQTFKEHPALSLKLLRLVNSVGVAGVMVIDSIQQALQVLGTKQLQNWVLLLLYTSDDMNAPDSLMHLAARRGKLMELLSVSIESRVRHSSDFSGSAFMVGLLSLVDALFGMTMQEALEGLSLAEDVKLALMQRMGDLGRILKLVEYAENGDFQNLEEEMELMHIPVQKFMAAQVDVMQWLTRLNVI